MGRDTTAWLSKHITGKAAKSASHPWSGGDRLLEQRGDSGYFVGMRSTTR
jgi:hypothetical protein